MKRLEEFAIKYDKPLSQVAINWLLANPAVTTVITGAKTPQQVEENVAASTWKIGSLPFFYNRQFNSLSKRYECVSNQLEDRAAKVDSLEDLDSKPIFLTMIFIYLL